MSELGVEPGQSESSAHTPRHLMVLLFEQGFQESTGVTQRWGAWERGAEAGVAQEKGGRRFRPREFGKEVGPASLVREFGLNSKKVQELENKFLKKKKKKKERPDISLASSKTLPDSPNWD